MTTLFFLLLRNASAVHTPHSHNVTYGVGGKVGSRWDRYATAERSEDASVEIRGVWSVPRIGIVRVRVENPVALPVTMSSPLIRPAPKRLNSFALPRGVGITAFAGSARASVDAAPRLSGYSCGPSTERLDEEELLLLL